MNSFGARETMNRTHDKRKLIAHYWSSFEIGFIRQERENSEIQIALVKLVGKLCGQLPRDFDFYFRVLLAELEDQLRQQVQTGALVRPDANTATLKGLELFERGETLIS